MLMVKKIILDTNFMMIVGQYRVDIFSEINRVCLFNYEIYIIDRTIDELNEIKKRKGQKNKINANIALNLIEIKEVKIIDTKDNKKNYADDVIMDIVDDNSVVGTVDIELKKRLKERKIPIITLRKKQYLVFEKFK
tara:strand:- start:575 stop:982 length:408 start_codon:yes stop_codon:yes gene_type:complete